ncbi:MAG: hypothetical protein HYZ28_23095 [Myxococcales bacterium]|nr:hypothetical protein [Myxococcales bacterium]
MARTAALLPLACALACSKGPYPVKVPPEPPPVAKTTVSPPPSVFTGKLTIRFETDRPATVFATTDGSDPRVEAKGRLTGAAQLSVQLDRTSVVSFFSRTPEGGEETVQTATYTRAGGEPGSISGVVVVGGLAVQKEIALSVDGAITRLGKVNAPGELRFSATGLDSGQHRLVAVADRNGDGNFWPLIDYASDTHAVTLDLKDPFKASAENVRIYLGTSQPGLATIQGTITLPDPPVGQNLSVSALKSDALGASADMNALLQQLQNGYRVFTNGTDKQYPYAITDLEPGRYVPVPALMGFGAGGLALNFIANPFKALNLGPGETGVADFAYGPVGISGTVTLKPAQAPQGIVYGVVAAKHASFTEGMQAVLMPAVFLPQTGTTDLKGSYAGSALRANASFQVRVFTSLEGQNPLTAALAWSINPFAGLPPQATVPTGSSDVKQDITVP